MATGGSIEAVSINGREFPVAADAEATIFPGGFTNESRSNGDGSGRLVKTRNPWKVSGVELAIDFSARDMTYLREQATGEDFAITFTLADDTVLGGTGQIEGEFTGSSQSSTVSIEFTGPGELVEQ